MALTAIDNHHDLPEFVIIELKKKDEVIKSQQNLITELQNKLSQYCKHGNASQICDSQRGFSKNGAADNGTEFDYLTTSTHEKAAVKIQRAYRNYLAKKALIMNEKSKRTKELIMKMTNENSDFITFNDSKDAASMSNLTISSKQSDAITDESSSHFENVLEGIEGDENFDETNGSFNSDDDDEGGDDDDDKKDFKCHIEGMPPLSTSSNNSTLRRAMSSTEPQRWQTTPPAMPPSRLGCLGNLEGTLKRDHPSISKIFSSSSNSIYPSSPDLPSTYSSPLHKTDQSRSFYSPRPSIYLDDIIANNKFNIVEMLQQQQNNNYRTYNNNNIQCCCSLKDCIANAPNITNHHGNNQNSNNRHGNNHHGNNNHNNHHGNNNHNNQHGNNHNNNFYDDVNCNFYQSSLTLSSTSSSSSSCLAPPSIYLDYQQHQDPSSFYDNNQPISNNNNHLTYKKAQEHKLTNTNNNNGNSLNNNNNNGIQGSNNNNGIQGNNNNNGIQGNNIQQTRVLTERNRKRLYRIGLNLFNKNPSMGIDFMIRHKFMERHPRAIAKFLISRKGLSRRMMGEYMGDSRDRLAADVLRYFSEELDLTGLQVDVALRLFQSHFRISGEAQMIERFMQIFSSRYCECNPHLVGRLVRSEDTIFLLSFAVIMLNTDLHNPSIKPDRRMTLQCFLKNLKGLDEGSDISGEFLSGVYERVRGEEFSLLADHTNQVVVLEGMITGMKETLVTMHRRFVCHCRMDEVVDLNRNDKPGSHVRGIFLFNDLLIVTKFWIRKKKESRHVMRHSIPLHGVSVYLLETPYYKHGIRLKRANDGLELVTLCARDGDEQMRFVEDLKESILETEKMEEQLVQWKENPGFHGDSSSFHGDSSSFHGDNRFSKDSGVMDVEIGQQLQQQQYVQQQQQSLYQHNVAQQNNLYQQSVLYRQHMLQQQQMLQQQHVLQQQQHLKQQKKLYQQLPYHQQQQQLPYHQQQQLQNVILQSLSGHNNNNINNIKDNSNMDQVFDVEAGDKRNSRTSVDSGLSSIGSFNNQQQLTTKTTTTTTMSLQKKL